MPTYSCRVCRGSEVSFFHRDKFREYYSCSVCRFVFVPETYFLSADDEKSVYDLHDNSSGDAGYRRFLSRASDPLHAYLQQRTGTEFRQVQGLDFGCGPTPVLAEMLREEPHCYCVDIYDVYYFPDDAVIHRTKYYDFIVSTEVFEHLYDPVAAIRNLWDSLIINGILIIMTKRVDGSIDKFRNWHYIRDPTHISFFHADTFSWLSNALTSEEADCILTFHGADVCSLVKKRRN